MVKILLAALIGGIVMFLWEALAHEALPLGEAVPTLSAEMPMWNWYGFPTTYTVAQGVVHLVGFLVAGLVAATLVRPAKV